LTERKLISDNTVTCVRIFLRAINYKAPEEIFEKLKGHPLFPDLLSISYVLQKLGINTACVNVNYDELRTEIPTPAIVHLIDNGGMFLVIDHLDEEYAYMRNERMELEKQPSKSFVQSWSGIVLVADVANVNPRSIRFQERVSSFIKTVSPFACAIGILLAIVFNMPLEGINTVHFIGAVLNTIAGLVMSFILLTETYDPFKKTLRKFCSSDGAKSGFNCQSVLESKGAKILGLISWSEVGTIHYLTALLLLLFSKIGVESVGFYSMLIMPYVFYSIYYQSKVIGIWCKLCLGVQTTILIGCALEVLRMYNEGFSSDLPMLVNYPFYFITLITTYLTLRPSIIQWQEAKASLPDLRKIKLDNDVFNFFLNRQPFFQDLPHTPIMNVKKTKMQIINVTNPTCARCREMHFKLIELKRTRPYLSIATIVLPDQDKDSNSYRITKTILTAYLNKSYQHAESIVSTYYDEYAFKADQWLTKFEDGDPRSDDLILSHFEWCKRNKIGATPSLFLNNHLLPSYYSVDDLEYIFE
jgi:uncharacterized membrane protein